MGSRIRKLLAAGLILAIGFGLAWPFRRQAEPSGSTPESPAPVSAAPVSRATPPPGETPAAQPQRLTAPIVLSPDPDAVAPTTPLAANTTSIANSSHHQLPAVSSAADPALPQLARQPAPATNDAVAPTPVAPALPGDLESAPRPVYASDIPFATGLAVPPKRATRIHVVHNGDTLARLARRYLGDDARAMEIFDLNRDVLVNPHLLPIGAELEIPPAESDKAEEDSDA